MIYPHHAAKMTALIHRVGYRPAMEALKRIRLDESLAESIDDSESETDPLDYEDQDIESDHGQDADVKAKEDHQSKTIFRAMQQERHLTAASSEEVLRVRTCD